MGNGIHQAVLVWFNITNSATVGCRGLGGVMHTAVLAGGHSGLTIATCGVFLSATVELEFLNCVISR